MAFQIGDRVRTTKPIEYNKAGELRTEHPVGTAAVISGVHISHAIGKPYGTYPYDILIGISREGLTDEELWDLSIPVTPDEIESEADLTQELWVETSWIQMTEYLEPWYRKVWKWLSFSR